MVKIERTCILLTKAEIQADIRSDKLTLKTSDRFRVSLPNENGISRAIYTHMLDSQDKSVTIEVTLTAFYKVEGVTSEADAKELHSACYKDIFEDAKKWIHEQAELVGIPGVEIQMDPREVDASEVRLRKTASVSKKN